MHGYVVTRYVRKTTRTYKGKTYTNPLLVESVHTPKGPRQKVICSLGDLKPRPKEAWLALARIVEAKRSGQEPLFDEPAPEAETKGSQSPGEEGRESEARPRRSSSKQGERSPCRPYGRGDHGTTPRSRIGSRGVSVLEAIGAG